jgi:hypothetical protein
MKVTFVILSSILLNLLVFRADAGTVTVSFARSASESAGLVEGYALFYQPTNAANAGNWIYLGQCPVGHTNIYANTLLLIANPVWFCVDTIGWDGKESAHSSRFLFTTNSTGGVISKLNLLPGNGKPNKTDVNALFIDVTELPEAAPLVTAAAPPVVNGIRSLPSGAVVLSGVGSAAASYTVFACTNLNSPDWEPIGVTSGDDTNLTFIDLTANSYSQRYYRFSQ